MIIFLSFYLFIMEFIQTYQLNNWNRISVYYDECAESPREWDNTGKLCIRQHRRYCFPNELDYDRDSAEEDSKKLYDEYHIFEIDCYEHSWISFSLSWWWMQCQFDTSKNCWFIAIPKNIYPDHAIAREIALEELKLYNAYMNWEVYRYTIDKPDTYTNKEWKEKIEWEFVDWCWGYYSIQDILDEYKSLSPIAI